MIVAMKVDHKKYIQTALNKLMAEALEKKWENIPELDKKNVFQKIKKCLIIIKDFEKIGSVEEADKTLLYDKISTYMADTIAEGNNYYKEHLSFFYNVTNDFTLRIIDTNSRTTKLLSLIYNGELIEELSGSAKIFLKLNNLEETSALFSLNVKFYNFNLKDLSFKPAKMVLKIVEFIHREGDRSEIVDEVLGFSLPYKEEAIQILLYIGNIIISKNPSIQIVGGVNIDNAANKVSLLFSKPNTSGSSSQAAPG